MAKNLPTWEPFTVPAGGLGIWLRLGDGLEESEISRLAAEARVQVSPGRPWFAGDPAAAFVRLSFAGADPASLGQGVRRLAKAIRAGRR